MNDTLLGEPGVQLQLGFDIPFVEFNEALEGHIQIRLLLHEELPFPGECGFLGGKTTLEFLLPLTAPVGVAELHIPCAVFFVLKCCHFDTSLVLISWSVQLFVEELPVDATCDDDAAGFCKLFIQLPNQLVGVGLRYTEFLCHFTDLHENAFCHRQFYSFPRFLCHGWGITPFLAGCRIITWKKSGFQYHNSPNLVRTLSEISRDSVGATES